jgi:hypothetical protein
MDLDREDRMLVEALRAYAKEGDRRAFPFDDLKFTLKMAADRIEELAKAEAPHA